ncbi:MAG: hypothetical protein AB7H93_06080 [Vicinamibacterales bacterium]
MTARTAAVIAGALAYLARTQDADGAWSDWTLPPGPSRTWTTAYVGWRLSALRPASLPAPDLDRAAVWLRAAVCADGGWGYAPATGPDADTTALATAFLRRRGIASPHGVARLLAHHQLDGGFATYTRAWNHGAWTNSHLEVTATAVLALSGEPGVPPEALQSARRFLRQGRGPDGLWPSYWWTTPLYATEVALACLEPDAPDLRRRTIGAVVDCHTTSGFASALQILCLMHLGADDLVRSRCAALRGLQLPDGSFPSAPVLRLTHRHVVHPWSAADAGPTFADEARTFSTATAVAALAATTSGRG